MSAVSVPLVSMQAAMLHLTARWRVRTLDCRHANERAALH